MIAAVTLALAIATPDPYAVYPRARSRWASQVYPPFLSYVVRISGTEASRGITNTYQSFVDTADNAITVRATRAEEAAHPYVPHGVNSA